SPTTPVIQASNGDFYGTLGPGAFRLTSDGAATMFRFPFGWSTQPTAASLVQVSDGQFYGTTVEDSGDATSGAVFSMTPDGQFTRLRAFSETDGRAPSGELIQGFDGFLYGVTKLGGASNVGSIFK